MISGAKLAFQFRFQRNDEAMIRASFKNRAEFFQGMPTSVKKADSKKILRDTGKLLDQDYRNWIKTPFPFDFELLITKEMRV